MVAQQAEPEFREPALNQYEVGDTFAWTHEKRLGKYVHHEGTVVEHLDDRIQVDVGNSNYYEINEVGRVVSISKNHNRTGVGYCVYK